MESNDRAALAAETPAGRDRLRSDASILAGITFVAMITATVVLARELPFAAVLPSALPPSLLLGFAGVAARFPCRFLPLRESSAFRLLATHLTSAVIAGALWSAAWHGWLRVVDAALGTSLAAAATPAAVRAIFASGSLIYLGAIAVHYLRLESETAARERRAALRYQLLAREAELRAFKAQVNPHFLFNSLNAIASLCGSSPLDARRMSQLLADFFRRTLRLGSERSIELREEIELARTYLQIEQIRFGRRLETRVEAAEEAVALRLPPLLLQPLVENAVRHGIGSMVEGGCVDIRASVEGERVRIIVENPADPDRPPSLGEGVGLANVRGRIEAMYGNEASMNVREEDGRFRVVLALPARRSGGAEEEITA